LAFMMLLRNITPYLLYWGKIIIAKNQKTTPKEKII
jgi:hypothetical protein